MAGLDKLREAIYSRDFKEPTRSPEGELPPEALQESAKPIPRSWTERQPNASAPLAAATGKQRHWIRNGVIIGVAAILVGGGWLGYTLFLATSDVGFSIEGPKEVSAGEPTVYTIRVTNRSSVPLTEVSATLTFPPGTITPDSMEIPFSAPRIRVPIGDVPAGERTEREVRVQLVGQAGHMHTIAGLLLYRPENISSQLTRETDMTTTIARVPIAVSVDVPERISSGQEVKMIIAVDSELSVVLPNMSLGVEFPAGFVFDRAEPDPIAPNKPIWSLGELVGGQSRTITVFGTLAGEPEEAKPFRMRVGQYEAANDRWLAVIEHTQTPLIASPFLLAQATLNGARGGALQPGTRVTGSVFYRNNLPDRVENLTVSASFPENLVDLRSVRAERGFYDVGKKSLVWNPSSESRLRELAAGGEGTLAFSFELKQALPINSFADKNFLFPVITLIDTANPPPAYRGIELGSEDRIEYRMASVLGLIGRTTYYESPFPNTGPLPPKVRETTTYTVFWELTSGGNDLRDVEVRGELAAGVEWRDQVTSDLGTVTFNPATHEVIWRIRDLPAATGVLRAPIRAAIQVAIAPAENQIGTSPNLLQNVRASGRDLFADVTQDVTVPNVSTELKSDSQSKQIEWRVAP